MRREIPAYSFSRTEMFVLPLKHRCQVGPLLITSLTVSMQFIVFTPTPTRVVSISYIPHKLSGAAYVLCLWPRVAETPLLRFLVSLLPQTLLLPFLTRTLAQAH